MGGERMGRMGMGRRGREIEGGISGGIFRVSIFIILGLILSFITVKGVTVDVLEYGYQFIPEHLCPLSSSSLFLFTFTFTFLFTFTFTFPSTLLQYISLFTLLNYLVYTSYTFPKTGYQFL